MSKIDFEVGDSVDIIDISTNKVFATGVAVKGDIPPFHMTVKFENPDGVKCNWYVSDDGLSGNELYKFKKSPPSPEIKFLKDYKVGDTVTIQKANGKRVNGVVEELKFNDFLIKYKRYNEVLDTWWFNKHDGCFFEDDFTKDFVLAVDNLSKWESKPNGPNPVVWSSLSMDRTYKNKEENRMRKTVTVELFDDDKGLEVQDSLVFRVENIVTEDNDQVTIQEVMMNNDIADYLNQHNEIRTMTVDLTILENTGNEVMLRPVKLKDLRWVVR